MVVVVLGGVVVVVVGVAVVPVGVDVGVPDPAPAGAVEPVPTAVRVAVRVGPPLGGDELLMATVCTGKTGVPPPERCAMPWG